jgi:hypothetical protein
MAGELGDIFWDLPPWITYYPGFDLGCSIYVVNPTDTEKEYSLIARLSRNSTVINEEALPVFGYAWFKVDPEDFVQLHGALRFFETNADLAVLLIERENEEIVDSVATRLVTPTTTAALPPGWPTTPGTSSFDWSSLLGMMLPFMMLGIIGVAMVSASRPKAEKLAASREDRQEEKKLLPAGRQE